MNKIEQTYYEITLGGKLFRIPLPVGQMLDINHKFIISTNQFYNGNKSLVIFYLLYKYCAYSKNTKEQWKRDVYPYVSTFTNADGSKWNSKVINYKRLNEYIKNTKQFKFEDFDFPRYNCDWLDLSIDANMNFHVPCGTTGMVIQDYSIKQRLGIEIYPQLDREGHLISTFLPQLIMRVVADRNNLISTSKNALTINWLFDFKELVNNSISLVDIFLMQLYTKAKYAPEKSWKFEEAKLGSKYGRRMSDKIRWVSLITGKNLNIESEKDAFNTLRELRNHLNHFDPPSFCASLEEIVEWLNMILSISTILYKMRECAGANISEELLTFMVQPIVKFEPQSVFSNRVQQQKSITGYKTSIWK